MTSRRWFPWIAAMVLVLAPADLRGARGQLAGYPSIGQFGGGYGTSALGGTAAAPPSGMASAPARSGAGYASTAGLYGQAYRVHRAQTTVALQPLYSAITSLPDGTARRSGPSPQPPDPLESRVLISTTTARSSGPERSPPTLRRPPCARRPRRPSWPSSANRSDRPRLDPAGHRRRRNLDLKREPARDQGPECHRG